LERKGDRGVREPIWANRRKPGSRHYVLTNEVGFSRRCAPSEQKIIGTEENTALPQPKGGGRREPSFQGKQKTNGLRKRRRKQVGESPMGVGGGYGQHQFFLGKRTKISQEKLPQRKKGRAPDNGRRFIKTPYEGKSEGKTEGPLQHNEWKKKGKP